MTDRLALAAAVFMLSLASPLQSRSHLRLRFSLLLRWVVHVIHLLYSPLRWRLWPLSWVSLHLWHPQSWCTPDMECLPSLLQSQRTITQVQRVSKRKSCAYKCLLCHGNDQLSPMFWSSIRIAANDIQTSSACERCLKWGPPPLSHLPAMKEHENDTENVDAEEDITKAARHWTRRDLCPCDTLRPRWVPIRVQPTKAAAIAAHDARPQLTYVPMSTIYNSPFQYVTCRGPLTLLWSILLLDLFSGLSFDVGCRDNGRGCWRSRLLRRNIVSSLLDVALPLRFCNSVVSLLARRESTKLVKTVTAASVTPTCTMWKSGINSITYEIVLCVLNYLWHSIWLRECLE